MDGKVSDVEEHLRAIFKAAIGANSVGESTDIKEGVTFNHHKNVFQAAMKISDQAMVSNNGFNTVLKGQPPSTYPLKNHYIEYTGYPFTLVCQPCWRPFTCIYIGVPALLATIHMYICIYAKGN